MRNAKKTLSLVMVAIFTTFIVLSGIPAGAVTTAQAKAQVTKATAAVVKAEAAVKSASFNPTTAQTINTAATKEVAKVNALGKTYKSTYVKLVARYQAVNKKIAARKLAIINAAKKVYTDAEKAVTAAENATDGDKVDLVGDETALANAQSAVTTALEMIVKLNQESSDYKGLMARIDAANNLIVKAMDEIAAAAAEKAAAEAAAAKAAEAAKVLAAAIEAAEKDVAALEAAPLTTLAEIDAAVVLGTKAAATVKTVTDTEKAAAFAARIKAVADKGIAAKATIDAKAAAEAEAKKPATIVSVSAVDGTITVTFNKKPITTVAAVDFVVTKTVTTTSAVTTTVVPTSFAVVSDTAVTLAVPAIAATDADQSVVYSVVYNATGSAVAAVAYKVAATPTLTATASTTNYKQIFVAFNQEVDATTAADITKYDVATGMTVSKAVLQADKKTVLLVLAAGMTKQTEYTVTITGVKSATTALAPTLTAKVTPLDLTVPTFSGVTVTNAKTIVFKANEPINTADVTGYAVLGNIKIDGVNPIGKLTVSAVENTLTVELSTLLAAGNHTFAVTGYADYAGFGAPDTSFTAAVVADTVIPVVTNASVYDRTHVILTFNKVVTATGTYTIDGASATPALGETMDLTNDKVVLTLGTPLTLAAAVEVTATYVNEADAIGNKSATVTTYKFKGVDDVTAPTVTAALDTTTTKNKITLTFSKPMQDAGTVEIINAAGTTVATLSLTMDSTRKVAVLAPASTTLNSVTTGTYTVKITNAKDSSVRQNALPTTSLTVAAVTTVAPTVVGGTYALTSTTDTVKIFFSTAMDATAIGTLSNYLVQLTPVSAVVPASSDANATVSVATDKKSVTLKFTGLTANNLATITIYNAKDASAIALVPVALAKNTSTTLALVSATATNTSTVKVVFNSALTSWDPASFILVNHTGGAAAFTFTNAQLDTADATNKTVLLTVNGSLKTNADFYDIKAGTSTNTKNIYADGTAIATTQLVDKVTPTLVSVKRDLTLTDTINLTFSENVTDAGTAIYDFVVYDVDAAVALVPTTDFTISITDNVLAIKVIKETVVGHKFTVALGNGRYLTDAASNKAVTFAATNVLNSAGTDVGTVTELTAAAQPVIVAQTVGGGASVSIPAVVSGYVSWLAPVATTVFAEGATMTKMATAAATTMTAPATAGTYKLYVLDAAGNISTASANAVTVDTTAPTVVTPIAAAGTILGDAADTTHTLVFSEALSVASKAAVKAAVDAAYSANGTSLVSSAWGGDNKTLTVTITPGTATPADDIVMAAIANIAVTDLYGNTSAALDVQQ